MSVVSQHARGKISGRDLAFVAQLAERSLGKTEVSGSIPDKGSLILFPGWDVAVTTVGGAHESLLRDSNPRPAVYKTAALTS